MSEIIIYQIENNSTQVDVILENDTVWLNQNQIVTLFNSSKANISEHITNIYNSKELEKKSTVRKIRTVQKEGKRDVERERVYYNLDLIISVGYRVNTKRGIQFRQWATNRLNEYLVKGYSINQKRLEEKKMEVRYLKSGISILRRSIEKKIEKSDEIKQMTILLDDFAKGLELLDDYDHESLDDLGKSGHEAVVITYEEYHKLIITMKTGIKSDLFGKEKDNSFKSSISQIYQSFGGKKMYPTIEEKAAMLLYLIVKNHSFVDGNKRIAAACFLYFLERNKLLYSSHIPAISNDTLASLTLFIAESKSEEMEVVKKVVVSILNRKDE